MYMTEKGVYVVSILTRCIRKKTDPIPDAYRVQRLRSAHTANGSVPKRIEAVRMFREKKQLIL